MASLASVLVRPNFELLLCPAYLILLGSMIACWGGSEAKLRRRLTLLKEIGRLSNPRFGVDRTIGSILERLRAFYDADACLFVLDAPVEGRFSLRRADRHNPVAAMRSESIPEGLANPLLDLPAGQAVVCRGKPRLGRGWRTGGGVRAYDVATGKRVANPPGISGALEADSFITVPFCYGGKGVGRLYLLAPRRGDFDAPEVDFLLQVLGHTLPAIGNIRLVDRLASDASEAERCRIARDLHDSVIQPYIGLRMGLAAELFQMVAEGLSNVRRHTSSMRATVGLACDDGHLVLRVGNDVTAGLAQVPFAPRSIMERAAALGGCGRVEWTGDGGTTVIVEIPL